MAHPVPLPRAQPPNHWLSQGMKLVADAEVEMTIGETEKGWRSLTVTKCTPPPEDPDKKEDDNGGVADPEVCKPHPTITCSMQHAAWHASVVTRNCPGSMQNDPLKGERGRQVGSGTPSFFIFLWAAWFGGIGHSKTLFVVGRGARCLWFGQMFCKHWMCADLPC